jgi:hypothetical protein
MEKWAQYLKCTVRLFCSPHVKVGKVAWVKWLEYEPSSCGSSHFLRALLKMQKVTWGSGLRSCLQLGLKVFLSLSILRDSSWGLKSFWVFPFYVFPFYVIPVGAKSLSEWFHSMSFHSTWFQLGLKVFLGLSILSLSILPDSSLG